MASPSVADALEHLEPWLLAADKKLAELRPSYVAASTILATLLMIVVYGRLLDLLLVLRDEGPIQAAINAAKRLPLVQGIVAKEKAKAISAIQAGKQPPNPKDPNVTEIPQRGMGAVELMGTMNRRAAKDVTWADGQSPMSGSVYMHKEHMDCLLDVYALFAHTNPLHGDQFASVPRFEAEVVAMTAQLLGGGPGGPCPTACGTMTSGGTESILLAVKAARDYMREKKGITQPEMVMAVSGHPAYVKAAEYFKIRLVTLPVGPDYRLTAARVKRAVGRNTIMVVASSPGYPVGVMDEVEGIAALAQRRGICCHVDCCLGGFVLPFARRLGYPVPPFHFEVPGVTSISVDTHKFGMGMKGTSVILYRSKDFRSYQFTSCANWTGGLYISPTIQGSRNGALICATWASLVLLGQEGFMRHTDAIMKAARVLRDGIGRIEGLEVMGEPAMGLVGFRSTDPGINIYKVNDLVSKQGWHLCPLQLPPGLHMCITASSVDGMTKLVSDLARAVKMLRDDPDCVQGGSAPVYGMASSTPDRATVGEILVAYQALMCDL